MQKITSVEEIKKLATPEELELYSYVVDNVELVVAEVMQMILDGQKSGDGGQFLIYGPQNSGKTLLACLIIDALIKNKITFVAIQPDVDRTDVPRNRYYSRSGVERSVLSVKNKYDLIKVFDKNDVVIIDEVQFLPSELQSFFLKMVSDFVRRGGWVVSVGILYTAQGSEFLLPAVLKEKATKNYELTATCLKCGVRGARLNQRLVDGIPTSSDDPELIPPSSKVVYEPRCGECHVING